MKKTIVKFILASILFIGFSAMQQIPTASVSGKVTPVDGIEGIWAIKDADTIKATISTEGAFTIEVKPGTWKIMVNAKAPYKSSEVKEVVVTEDKNTDVREIILQQ